MISFGAGIVLGNFDGCISLEVGLFGCTYQSIALFTQSRTLCIATGSMPVSSTSDLLKRGIRVVFPLNIMVMALIKASNINEKVTFS